MGGRPETMCNKTTFIFSEEQHGNILYMHLIKYRKPGKWKSKKLKFANENYIYCS